MNKRSVNHSLLPVLLLALAMSSPGSADEHYRQSAASRDGIGKFYLDREISHVMGHRGAGWLERSERVQQERTDLLLQSMSAYS